MKMKLFLSLLIINCIAITPTRGQEWTETRVKALQNSPSSYSIDSENNIFVGYANGSIQKFSPSGNELQSFSMPNQSEITLIEAQNNRKIFLFQKDIQNISILDRFSSVPRQYQLSDFGVDFALSACPTPDGAIWIAENNPQRFKKIDLLRKNVLLEVQYELADSIMFMKAVQNLVFISTENGLHILDQYGNLLSSNTSEKINYVQVTGNKVIASTTSGFLIINSDDGSISDKVSFPYKPAEVFFEVQEEIAVITKESLTFYKVGSEKK